MPTNPENRLFWQAQEKNIGHPRDWTTSAKKTCLLHVPGHSTEYCKVLKEYPDKYSAQRPHQEKEARSGDNKNRAKTFKFNSQMQEVKVMVSHDEPTLRKKKGKNHTKNPKSENDSAVPAEGERNYGIDRLNIGEPANDSEDDSES